MRPARAFVVLLPLKGPATAKSRLGEAEDARREQLAVAFARDVVATSLVTPEVAQLLVISDDLAFAEALVDGRGDAFADPGGGLNPALVAGCAHAAAHWPDLQPVALLGDLPSLRVTDLSLALTLAGSTTTPCFVRDADGTGTTFYTAAYDDFDPRFGIDSASAHVAAGAAEIPGELGTLRRDVDDETSLAAAIGLGVGSATAAVLAANSEQTG